MPELVYKISMWVTAEVPQKVLDDWKDQYKKDGMTYDDALKDLGHDLAPGSQGYECAVGKAPDPWVKCHREIDEIELEEGP